MSADHGYTLDRAALLADAEQVTACDVFRVEADGSRHHCADCGQALLAHLVVALRQSCGTCAHYDTWEGKPGRGVCAPTERIDDYPSAFCVVASIGRCEAWEKRA